LGVAISRLARLFFLSFVLCFGTSLWAARTALIAIEGAMVYKNADFDSAVIGYLPRGKPVRISTKNFGPFHRILFREGVIGYISDVDLVTQEGVPLSALNSGEVPDDKKRRKKIPREFTRRQVPVGNARAIGVAVGLISYRELVNRREYSGQLRTYGLRYSSRAPFLLGPYGWDVTLLMQFSAPDYYNGALGVPAQASYYFLDAVWTFPMIDFNGKNGVLIAGIGPLLSYSEAKATLSNGQSFKQSDTIVGASLQLGAAFRLSPVIIKGDVKYYLDKSSYLGILGSVQYEF